jgi:hypothetical protein
MREAAVELRVRPLVGPGRDTDLVDPHVGAHAPPIPCVRRVGVRVEEIPVGDRPEAALEAERLLLPRQQHDVHELLEVIAVGIIGVRPGVPRPDGVDLRADAEGVNPARLVAADEADAELAPEHVVERGDVLRRAHRVVRGGHPPDGVDAEARRVLADPHRHEAGFVRDLEALDLQVVLGMPEAGEPGLIGELDVGGDLVEHPLVELGALSGHATLELVAAADRAVHEQVELHGSLRPVAPVDTADDR